MDNGLVEDWGKLRTMSDPNACYLIMLNIDRQIVGVLSPMQNGARINVKTGAVMDTESMNKFTNCIPIGILLNEIYEEVNLILCTAFACAQFALSQVTFRFLMESITKR